MCVCVHVGDWFKFIWLVDVYVIFSFMFIYYSDVYCRLEEPILQSLWQAMEWFFFGYNSPKRELIWTKPGI